MLGTMRGITESSEQQEVKRTFDPRTEVSADAKFIVKRLVLWLLGVPLLIATLIWVFQSAEKARIASESARASRELVTAEMDAELSVQAAHTAGRIMRQHIEACKGAIEWPVSDSARACINKVRAECMSTSGADKNTLAIECSP